jgi:hypothetical protein
MLELVEIGSQPAAIEHGIEVAMRRIRQAREKIILPDKFLESFMDALECESATIFETLSLTLTDMVMQESPVIPVRIGQKSREETIRGLSDMAACLFP